MQIGVPTSLHTVDETKRASDLGRAGSRAYEVLFRQRPRDLYPVLYEVVENALFERALELRDRIEGRDDRRSIYKREVLTCFVERLRLGAVK